MGDPAASGPEATRIRNFLPSGVTAHWPLPGDTLKSWCGIPAWKAKPFALTSTAIGELSEPAKIISLPSARQRTIEVVEGVPSFEICHFPSPNEGTPAVE